MACIAQSLRGSRNIGGIASSFTAGRNISGGLKFSPMPQKLRAKAQYKRYRGESVSPRIWVAAPAPPRSRPARLTATAHGSPPLTCCRWPPLTRPGTCSPGHVAAPAPHRRCRPPRRENEEHDHQHEKTCPRWQRPAPDGKHATAEKRWHARQERRKSGEQREQTRHRQKSPARL